MTNALLPTDWILRYSATSTILCVVNDVPLSLTGSTVFALPESDALSLLALFQRRRCSSELSIVHRPKGSPHVRS